MVAEVDDLTLTAQTHKVEYKYHRVGGHQNYEVQDLHHKAIDLALFSLDRDCSPGHFVETIYEILISPSPNKGGFLGTQSFDFPAFLNNQLSWLEVVPEGIYSTFLFGLLEIYTPEPTNMKTRILNSDLQRSPVVSLCRPPVIYIDII